MDRNRMANVLSWLAMPIALTCVVGLGLAAALHLKPDAERTVATAYAFLFVTRSLLILGLGSILVAGVSSYLATTEATRGQGWRTRVSLLLGFISLCIGLIYGVVLS